MFQRVFDTTNCPEHDIDNNTWTDTKISLIQSDISRFQPRRHKIVMKLKYYIMRFTRSVSTALSKIVMQKLNCKLLFCLKFITNRVGSLVLPLSHTNAATFITSTDVSVVIKQQQQEGGRCLDCWERTLDNREKKKEKPADNRWVKRSRSGSL